jgi:hypothetical protein
MLALAHHFNHLHRGGSGIGILLVILFVILVLKD